MTIKFYSMNGCGYCQMSKELLKDEIKNGIVVIMTHDKAPKTVKGFPYFEANGKSFSGYPGNKETLFKQLGFTGVMTGGCSSNNTKKNYWKYW